MAWLTGYDGHSTFTKELFGPEGDPVFWGRAMDARGALRTCYMPEDHIISYSDAYVMTTQRHAMSHLAELIFERGWGSSRLGVELENYYYSARAHQVLSEAHDGQISDATLLVNWCRAVKSNAEIKFIRRAARIVEKMHRAIFEKSAPTPKNELVAEIYKASLIGAEDDEGSFGGDYSAIVPLLPTGLDATAAHLTWDDQELQVEAMLFEIAGCYRRYHAPLCRTVYLGIRPRICF